MNLTLRSNKLILFTIFSAALLSGCGGGATPEPTQDIRSFATSAALTVQTEFTQTAASVFGIPVDTIPTNPPLAVQNEPLQEAEAVQVPAPMDEVLIPGVLSVSEIDGNNSGDLIVKESEKPESLIQFVTTEPTPMILKPTVTATTPPTAVPTATEAKISGADKASYETQEPLDGTHVKAGSSFDVTWFLMNTGTTTWTTDYSMRYFTGTDFTKPGKPRFNLNYAVEPGTVGSCSIDAVAPTHPGTYKMSVVLGNANDENFFIVDITIIVD